MENKRRITLTNFLQHRSSSFSTIHISDVNYIQSSNSKTSPHKIIKVLPSTKKNMRGLSKIFICEFAKMNPRENEARENKS